MPVSRHTALQAPLRAGESTRLVNRIRGLLVTIHPALEKAIGPRLHHPAALELLITYGGPDGLRGDRLVAGPDRLDSSTPELGG